MLYLLLLNLNKLTVRPNMMKFSFPMDNAMSRAKDPTAA